MHKFLKKQGKEITGQIKAHLEKLGFSKVQKDDSTNQPPPEVVNMADLVLNTLDQTAWNTLLAELLQSMLYDIYIAGAEDAQGTLSGTFAVDETFHQYATDYSQQRTAELVGKKVLADGSVIDNPNQNYAISDSTRDMLRGDLIDYMNQGLTPAEIAKNLENNYAFSETRSMTIARTETGFSWNSGAVQMYDDSDVKLLYVHDGDSDPECHTADGEIWTTAHAMAHPLQHPNCVRSFAPCLDPDAEPDRG